MKNKITSLLMLSMILTSCGGTPSVKDYQTDLEFKPGYKVCLLTDIHLSYESDIEVEFTYLKEAIYANALIAHPGIDVNDKTNETLLKEFAPDIIFLNGDTFMDANKQVVDSFFRFLDSFDIKFGLTYGNHDIEGLYGRMYIDTVLKNCKNSIYKNPLNDNVYGNSNYVVNLKSGNEVKWQLISLDTNTYLNNNYDSIHDDQIEWYKKQVLDGNKAPSLLFTHIPVEEYSKAWEEETNGEFTSVPSKDYTGDSIWWMNEKSNSSTIETNMFETIQELEATQGIVSGHDHINCADFKYKGEEEHEVRLIYALKTGHGIYHDERLMGVSFFTLSDGTDFENDKIFLDYNHNAFVMTDNYLLTEGREK